MSKTMKKRKVFNGLCCALLVGIIGFSSLNPVYAYSSSHKSKQNNNYLKPTNYKITYDLQGGTFNTSNVPTEYNGFSNTFKLSTPMKLGSAFAGFEEQQDKLGPIKVISGNVYFNNDVIIMTNLPGATLNRVKCQLFDLNYNYIKDIEDSVKEVGKYKFSYIHQNATGNYCFSIGANADVINDSKLFVPVYLEKGREYIIEYDVDVFSGTKIVINDVKFYRKDGTNVNIPSDIIAKGSYGNRNYIAIWK